MEAIEENRKKIDAIDNTILQLLKERFALVKEIGRLKKQSTIAVKDEAREQSVVTKLQQKAQELDINSQLINEIWGAIFKESYKIEKE